MKNYFKEFFYFLFGDYIKYNDNIYKTFKGIFIIFIVIIILISSFLLILNLYERSPKHVYTIEIISKHHYKCTNCGSERFVLEVKKYKDGEYKKTEIGKVSKKEYYDYNIGDIIIKRFWSNGEFVYDFYVSMHQNIIEIK